MNHSARVEVTVFPGGWESPISVGFALDEFSSREVFEPLEMSNSPFAVAIKSTPGRDYLKIRRQKMQFRGATAKAITDAIAKALADAFARRDTNNGYDKEAA